MAESEPTIHNVPKDERAIAAQLKQDYLKAQFDADQKEVFGKFDTSVPGNGEDTYQSYIDQRPAEGIVRDGEDLRDAQSGKFAGIDAYEAQNGTAQEHYDSLGGLMNSSEYQQPDYASMGAMELAKEAAKARELGDTFEEKAIREAFEQHLTIDALKDDTESPEEAQARYEADVARYDSLVDRFSRKAAEQQNDTHSATSETSKQLVTLENPSTEAIEASEEESTEAEAETETAAETEATDALAPGAYYEGKKVTVASVEEHPDDKSKDLLTVVDEDGNVSTIQASEINYVGAAPATGKVMELYKGEREQAAKSWWQKTGDYIRPRAGVAFWAAKFETFKHDTREKWDAWLNHNVEDSMSEEEKDKHRKRNRYAAIAAGAGLGLVAAIAGGVLIAQGLDGNFAPSLNGNDHGNGDGFGNPDGGGVFTPGAETPDVQDNGGLTPDVVADTDRVEVLQFDNGGEINGVETVETASFAPGSGEGGEALFRRLGINPATWYDHANTLLTQFPQDFYLEGRDVRFAHSGSLSQGAQDYINSLRQG